MKARVLWITKIDLCSRCSRTVTGKRSSSLGKGVVELSSFLPRTSLLRYALPLRSWYGV
jgi:hypothetical protein